MANLTAKIYDGNVELGSYPVAEKRFSSGKDGFYVAIRNRTIKVDGEEFTGQIMFFKKSAPKASSSKYVL